MTIQESPQAEIFIRARDFYEQYGQRQPPSQWNSLQWASSVFMPPRDDWVPYFTLYIDKKRINEQSCIGGIIQEICSKVSKEYAEIMKKQGVKTYTLFNGSEREPTANLGDLYTFPKTLEDIFREAFKEFEELKNVGGSTT